MKNEKAPPCIMQQMEMAQQNGKLASEPALY